MGRVTTIGIVMTVFLTTLVADADPAAACSCLRPPETPSLDEHDAAFIGTANELITQNESYAIVGFRVDEVIKGDVEASVYLAVENSSSSCGDPLFVPGGALFGEPAGVMITDVEHLFLGVGCTGYDPDYVRSGVPGLDQPNPDLPAQAVVIGEFRETTMRLIGKNGQVVAYVQDEHPIGDSKVCADGETLASIVADGETLSIQWRSLRSLAVIETLPINFVNVTARENSGIIDCLADLSTLVGRSTELRLLDPEGRVRALNPGQGSRGSLSPDGTVFARWVDATSFEVVAVGVSDTAPTVVSVANHRGNELAISPDNSRFAFFRREGRDLTGWMEVVIVDMDGTELHVVLEPEFFQEQGLSWLDEETLGVGTTRIDLADGEARVAAHRRGETYGQWNTSQKGPRVIVDDGSGPLLLGLEHGWTVDLGPRQLYGELLALPAPLEVSGVGFVPAGRPSTPLAGATLASTVESVRSSMANPPGSPFIATDARPGLTADGLVIPTSEGALREQPPAWLVLVYGGLIGVVLVAFFFVIRRWSRRTLR